MPSINFGTGEDYIEAKIRLSPNACDRRPDVKKQNLISIGQGIEEWPKTANGKYTLHFYYPCNNAPLLRMSAVIGQKTDGNNTDRTLLVIKLPKDTEVITIRVTANGVYVNGHLIEIDPDDVGKQYNRDNKSKEISFYNKEGNEYKYYIEQDSPTGTYQNLITNFLSQDHVLRDLEIGSLEGVNRSWAYYDYIVIHKQINE